MFHIFSLTSSTIILKTESNFQNLQREKSNLRQQIDSSKQEDQAKSKLTEQLRKENYDLLKLSESWQRQIQTLTSTHLGTSFSSNFNPLSFALFFLVFLLTNQIVTSLQKKKKNNQDDKQKRHNFFFGSEKYLIQLT